MQLQLYISWLNSCSTYICESHYLYSILRFNGNTGYDFHSQRVHCIIIWRHNGIFIVKSVLHHAFHSSEVVLDLYIHRLGFHFGTYIKVGLYVHSSLYTKLLASLMLAFHVISINYLFPEGKKYLKLMNGRVLLFLLPFCALCT